MPSYQRDSRKKKKENIRFVCGGTARPRGTKIPPLVCFAYHRASSKKRAPNNPDIILLRRKGAPHLGHWEEPTHHLSKRNQLGVRDNYGIRPDLNRTDVRKESDAPSIKENCREICPRIHFGRRETNRKCQGIVYGEEN